MPAYARAAAGGGAATPAPAVRPPAARRPGRHNATVADCQEPKWENWTLRLPSLVCRLCINLNRCDLGLSGCPRRRRHGATVADCQEPEWETWTLRLPSPVCRLCINLNRCDLGLSGCPRRCTGSAINLNRGDRHGDWPQARATP